MSTEKEVPLVGGGVVCYAGSADTGLSLELEDGSRFELSREQVRRIFERFAHRNPLDQDGSEPHSSLALFVEWAGDPGEAWLGRCLDDGDARRVLAVFMGEGLLPMELRSHGPQPGEFPRAGVKQCLGQVVGRLCVLEVGRQITPVMVRHVAGDAAPEAASTEDEQIRLEFEAVETPGFAWQGPQRFTVGTFASDIHAANGRATASYGGWTLVTGTKQVAELLAFAERERPAPRAMLQELRRVAGQAA
jgi:hypothetical protein